jgi:hypothetical protein
MATSNSRDFDLDVAEIIEEAYERCGLESRTGYDLKQRFKSLDCSTRNSSSNIWNCNLFIDC